MKRDRPTSAAVHCWLGGGATKNFHLLISAFLLSFVIGCGDSVEKAKKQAVATATNALANYKGGDPSNFLAFRTQIRAMKASLATNDFSKASECARQIDKLLQTKVVAQSIEFLRIGSANGAQKAKSAIAEYMAKNSLDVAETEACRELLRYFEEMDKRQTADLVAAIVYIALERKMSHGAAIPAGLAHIVMEEFLGIASTSNPPPVAVEPK